MAKNTFTLQSVLDLRRTAETQAAARLGALQARVRELEQVADGLREQLGRWHAWRNDMAREQGGVGRLAGLAGQLSTLSASVDAADAAVRAAIAERRQGEADWVECRKKVLALEKLEERQREAFRTTQQRVEDRRVEDWVLAKDHAMRDGAREFAR